MMLKTNRYLRKDMKYTLDYQPRTDVPAGLMAYVRMVIARDPWMWAGMIIMDIIHGIRYPLSFFLTGVIIDRLSDVPKGAAIPHDVWMYTGLIFAALLIGEMAHMLPHYLTFDWWKRARAELRSDLMTYTLGHSFTYFQNHFAGSLARKVSEGVEKGLNLQEQVRWQILLPLVSMGTSGLILLGVSWVYGSLVCAFLILFCCLCCLSSTSYGKNHGFTPIPVRL